ncbi:MAG: hypothetical protein EPN85_05220 [Bacteroidetes bacterium]|nr:MAG: hypothetical protein EPN85_05220 [Bacteroidota bacterium]
MLPAVCCLLLAFPSCKQKNIYSEEISKLDSSKTALSIAQKNIANTLASDSIAIALLSKSLEEIKAHLPSDTVNKQTGAVLSEISNLKSMITDLMQYRTNYVRASEKSLERINSLQHDLKENLIEDNNKAREYIVNETNALTKIITELKLIKELSRVSSNKLDSLRPRITFVIDSLNSK